MDRRSLLEKTCHGSKKTGRGSERLGRGSQNKGVKKNSLCIQNLFPVCFKGINLLNARGVFEKTLGLFSRIKVSWEGSFGPYFWKTGHLREIR